MTQSDKKVRWPDGVSLSWTPSLPRIGQIGIGGSYYWSPGSDTAPPLTITGMYGRGRDVWRIGPPLASFNGGFVFRRGGMSSADSLGYGTTTNVSTGIPSVTLNTSIPDENGIPLPAKNKVSSIEAGLSNSIGASRAFTYTVTPQQIADFLTRYGSAAAKKGAQYLDPVTPAMGPNDELSPFERNLRGGVGSAGVPSEAPVRYLSRSQQGPLGDGMGDWRTSATPVPPWSPTAAAASPPRPGGLYGLMLDYLRDNYSPDR